MKFKKIVSCECNQDSILGSKNTIEIKVENHCKTYEYFIFNDNFNLIKVIHELPQVY